MHPSISDCIELISLRRQSRLYGLAHLCFNRFSLSYCFSKVHACYYIVHFSTGGGGVALVRILFVLPIVRSKLELFLMRPLQAKFGKICQWTKKIKDAVVFGWGRQIFPKSPRENKHSSNVSAACLFKNIDARYCSKSFLSVFTQKSVALLCGVMCDPKTNPKIFGSADFFRSFGPTKK